MARAIRKERSNKAIGSFPSFPLESRCLPEACIPEACTSKFFTSETCVPETSVSEADVIEISVPSSDIFLLFPSCSGIFPIFPSCSAIPSLPFSMIFPFIPKGFYMQRLGNTCCVISKYPLSSGTSFKTKLLCALASSGSSVKSLIK